jgi:hypothetical protein
MRNNGFRWLVQVAVVLVACFGALAQSAGTVKLSGVISDYTPSNVSPTGPWEVRGNWSLLLKPTLSQANFAAALTMVRSDYWITQNPGNVDDPSLRSPHTHHIRLINGTVTSITNGFEVTGVATVTGNGNAPPFGLSIPIVIDITGGTNVQYSNIKLTFQSPADAHFGTEPLEGVVQR